jgi:hypothetical protein
MLPRLLERVPWTNTRLLWPMLLLVPTWRFSTVFPNKLKMSKVKKLEEDWSR